ncbi:MAG: peptide deformylase [Candidatus Adiutrix sp.]
MALLPILKYPDPRLREKSLPVEHFNDELRQLAADMLETMRAVPGAGLAAPQVGHLIRMIVVSATPNGQDFDDSAQVLVNPRITHQDGHQLYNEGCLSVVDLYEQVTRAQNIEIEAQDLDGRPFNFQADGRRAVILQHEIDHLDGILFIDHLSALKRNIYKRKLKKLAKEGLDD